MGYIVHIMPYCTISLGCYVLSVIEILGQLPVHPIGIIAAATSVTPRSVANKLN